LASTALVRSTGAFFSRILRLNQKAAPGVTIPTGGYVPPDWPINWWQLGRNPLPYGG
jgi:hypothetical protein